MSARDAFIRQAPTAPRPEHQAPVFGADMFRRQQLVAEVTRGREAVAGLGARVQCLYEGARAAGAAVPGVMSFRSVPPPHPGAEALVASVARGVVLRPGLLRAIQVAVFRFEDYRRALDRAEEALVSGPAPEGAIEDLKRRAYHVSSLGAAFQDEPGLASLFPLVRQVVSNAGGSATGRLIAPATTPLAGGDRHPEVRVKAGALAQAIASYLPEIEAVLALIDHPSAPALGELLSGPARARRSLSVRAAGDPAALTLLRGCVQGHAALTHQLGAKEPALASLATACERLSRLVFQGRRHAILAPLFGGKA